MKATRLVFLIIALAMTQLSSCADLQKFLGGTKVSACYQDICVSAELPKSAPVTESGKEVTPVQ